MSIVLASWQVMMTDSQAGWGDIKTSDPAKVRRIHDNLVGTVGDLGMCHAWFDWYTRQIDEEVAPPRGGGDGQTVDALILRPDGLYWNEGMHDLIMPVHEPAWATGSGMWLAMGALFAGASLLTAMVVACERERSCGWPIRWYALDGEEGVITHEEWSVSKHPLLLARPFQTCRAGRKGKKVLP